MFAKKSNRLLFYAIFMVRDYDASANYLNLLDQVLRHRDSIISHLNNDTMSALGRPQDMFSDTAIQLKPIFAQWIQNTCDINLLFNKNFKK